MAQTGIADIFNKMIVVLYSELDSLPSRHCSWAIFNHFLLLMLTLARQGMEEVIEQNELQYLRHNDIVHTFVDFSVRFVFSFILIFS